jgi:antitoxin CptB
MHGPEYDARLKKLKYRAWHRGFREADLIIGPFADKHLHQLDAAVFERLLDVPDQDLYAWIVGREPTPQAYQGDVMELLQGFRFFAHAAIDPERRGA